MAVPDWWSLTLLALCAYRLYRLIAEDTILNRPRRYLLRLGDWEKEGDPYPEDYRFEAGLFITCPWCLGFWLSVLLTVSWWIWPHGTEVFCVPWAISAIVGLTAKNLDKDEE